MPQGRGIPAGNQGANLTMVLGASLGTNSRLCLLLGWPSGTRPDVHSTAYLVDSRLERHTLEASRILRDVAVGTRRVWMKPHARRFYSKMVQMVRERRRVDPADVHTTLWMALQQMSGGWGSCIQCRDCPNNKPESNAGSKTHKVDQLYASQSSN